MTNLKKGKYYIVYSSNDCSRCLKFEEMLEPTARFTDFKGTIVITALKSFTNNKIDYSVAPGLISFVIACKLTGMFITRNRLAAQELSKMFRCEIRDNEIFFIYKGDILPMKDYFNKYIEKEIPLYTLDSTGLIIDAAPFRCCESIYKPQPITLSCERYFTEVKSTNLTIDDYSNIILMNNKEEKKMKSNKYIDKVVALYSDNKHIGYGLLVDENEKEFKLQFEPIHKTATYNKNSYEYRPASVYYIKDRHESICFAFIANKHNLDILKSCWRTFEAFNIKEDNTVYRLMVKNGVCLSLFDDAHTQLVMNRYGYLDYIDLYAIRDIFITKSYLTSLKDDIKELSKFDIANFHTTEGVRYESDKQYKDRKGGKQVNTITTHISYKGKEATATIDANEYDERQGILEACANLVFDNFDSEYEKYLKKKKQLADKEKVCTICGKKFKTAEAAHECVEKHNESKKRKEQRYQEYLLRKEAHKKYNELKHEEQVNDYIKKLYEKESKTENTNND